MNSRQKGLRTKWGMASHDYRCFELAYNHIPKKYKKYRKLLKAKMEKLKRDMDETMAKMTMYGD